MALDLRDVGFVEAVVNNSGSALTISASGARANCTMSFMAATSQKIRGNATQIDRGQWSRLQLLCKAASSDHGRGSKVDC
jgi:hypothetical protein